MKSKDETKKNNYLWLGIVLAVLVVACMAFVGAGAAYSGEISNDEQFKSFLEAKEDSTGYLTYDPVAKKDKFTTKNGHTKTLDLNGHTITGDDSKYPALMIKNKTTFILKDSAGGGAISGSTYDSKKNGAGGVKISGDSTFKFESGTIKNCETKGQGAGVFVDKGGHFYMYGTAVIENCKVLNAPSGYPSSGGGVFINKGGYFEMYGTAKITNCTSKDGGAGVCVDNESTFKMKENAEITNCTVTDSDDNGGGVFIYDNKLSKFIMDGGTISGCSANKGGGVYINKKGNFCMNGGTITKNTAYYIGGGVYRENTATFTQNGGTIEENIPTDIYPRSTSLADNEITYDINLSYYKYGYVEDEVTHELVFKTELVKDQVIKYEDFKDFFQADHVYYIKSFEDLVELANLTNHSHQSKDYNTWRESAYILANDIDCSSVENMPSIGMAGGNDVAKYTNGTFFNGSFWGNGYSIKNFKQSGKEACGLIARAGKWSMAQSKGTLMINYLTMDNCYINNNGSNEGVGAFVGRIDHAGDYGSIFTSKSIRQGDAMLIGCTVKNSTILSEDEYVGGLVGQSYSTDLDIIDCSVEQCKIFSHIGGLLATSASVGGLVGGTDDIFLIKAVEFGLESVINDTVKLPGITTISFYNDTVDQCKIGAWGGPNVGGAVGDASTVRLFSSDDIPQGVKVTNCFIETNWGNCGGLFGHVDAIFGGKAYNGEDIGHHGEIEYYYSAENTVTISDDTWVGVVAGDINFPHQIINFLISGQVPDVKYILEHAFDVLSDSPKITLSYFISTVTAPGECHRLLAKEAISGGKSVFLNGPGFLSWVGDDGWIGLSLNISSGSNNYYVSDSNTADYLHPDIAKTLTLKNENGDTIATSWQDFNKELLKTEWNNGVGTISAVDYTLENGEGGQIVNLGEYGTLTGYGYVDPKNLIPVNFYTTTIYRNDDGSTLEVTECVESKGYKYQLISEPETIVQEDGFTFTGWYKDYFSEDTKWNFSEDRLTEPLNLHARIHEIIYDIRYYDRMNEEGHQYLTLQSAYYSQVFTLKDEEYLMHNCGTYHPGYTLIGWNTEEDGSGTSYAPGQAVSKLTTEKNGVVKLYAQWMKEENPVLIFVMNGHGEQQEPVSAENGIFTKPADPVEAHYTFDGWYDDDSLTTVFNFEDTYQSNQTAYAKWSEYTYSIVFDPNGGEGSMESITDVPYSAAVLLPTNEFTRNDYCFDGWKLGDTLYSNKDAVEGLTEENGGTVTMVAQWKSLYIFITFNDSTGFFDVTQGGTGLGGYFAVPNTPAVAGYTFYGWYADPDCTELFDFEVPYTEDQQAYAKWTENTYSVHFDPNAGDADGEMADMTDILYTATVNLTENAFVRDNYTFTGWNTEADGSGTAYGNGNSINELTPVDKETITLYAQWDDIDEDITLTYAMNNRGDQIKTETYTKKLNPETGVREATFVKPENDPTSPGGNFAGWYADTDCTVPFVFGPGKTESEVAYAKWEDVEGVYVWDDKNAKYVNVENSDEMAESSLTSTVTYNSGTNTLTLNGYHADYNNTVPEDNYGAIYSSKRENVTIELADGSQNTIGTARNADNIGIFSHPGSITITGPGELTIYSRGDTDTTVSVGIYSSGEVIINGGCIDIHVDSGDPGTETGIYGAEGVTVTGGSVTVEVAETGGNITGIYGKEIVVISGGSVAVSGGGYGLYSEKVVKITGGSVSTDNCNVGIATECDFIMVDGILTITNAVTGIYFTSDIDLSNMTSGQIELTVTDRPFSQGNCLTISEVMKVYVGDSAETKELITVTDSNDLITNKDNYMLLVCESTVPVTYTVFFYTGGDGNVSPSAISGLHGGEAITVSGNTVTIENYDSATAVPDFGYKFTGWTYEGGDVPSSVTGNMTITANFEEIPQLVTITTKQTTVQYQNGNAVTTSAENTYEGCKDSTITADLEIVYPTGYEAAGYEFSGWCRDEKLTEPWDFSTDKLTGDTTLYAKLEEKNYNIVYHDGEKIDFDRYVGYTENKTLKTLSDSQKTFLGWATEEGGSAVYQGGQTVSKLLADGNFNLYAVWQEQTTFTVTFLTNTEEAQVTTGKITNVAKGTPITVNGTTVTIGSYGSSTASCSSFEYEFTGWSCNGSALPETVTEDMTILASFVYSGLDIPGIYVLNDEITFDTLIDNGTLPAAKEIIVLNNSSEPVTVTTNLCGNFHYEGLATEIPVKGKMQATVQPVELVHGEYQDKIYLSTSTASATVTVSLSVIDDSKIGVETAVVPSSPLMVVTDYFDDEGTEYTLVSAKTIEYKGTTAIIPADSGSNISVTVKNVEAPLNNMIYLGSDAEISVSYPARQITVPGITTEDPGYYNLTMGIISLNEPLPSVSGTFDVNAADAVEDIGYIPVVTITSLNSDTTLINENLKTLYMDIEIPGKNTIENPNTVTLFHVENGVAGTEGITASANFDETKNAWMITADSDAGFSTYVVAYKTSVTPEPETNKSSSSVTSFSGTKDGSDFTFDRAVVITKATLPGATYATVTNTSGSGWYTCNLSTDGTNGVLYFQVPQDVIDIKGWTVNDVSLLGCKTTYLTSEGGYAKYSAVITGAGSYTIDFEKDAAQKAAETKPVMDTQGYLNVLSTPSGATIQIEGVDYIGFTPQEKISLIPGTYTVTLSLAGYDDESKTVVVKAGETTEAVLSLTKTETTAPATAAKSPLPVLGILAGLGIAGFVALRRH